MRNAVIAVVVTLLAVGGAAWWMNSQGTLQIGKYHPYQVTGDPPVTVSDGSLHAKSKNGWTTSPTAPANPLIAMPASGDTSKGSLVAGATCALDDGTGAKPPKYLPAALWTDDDKVYPIAPGATIVVNHDPGEASTATAGSITIALPATTGPLTITAAEGNFQQEDLDPNTGKVYAAARHNRRHIRPGDVSSIVITNPGSAPYKWTPPTKNPHFTLAFCYQ